MGCCSAKENDVEMVRNMEEEESNCLRICLIGPGDTGKTTLLKQVRKLNGKATEDERETYVDFIREAIMDYSRILCKMSEEFSGKRQECRIADDSLQDFVTDLLDSTKHLSVVDEHSNVSKLWADTGIQATFGYRNEFYLPENVAYFMDRIDAIAAEDYCPQMEDYLHIHVRSTGHCEEVFEVQRADSSVPLKLKIEDMAGCNAERKKYMGSHVSAEKCQDIDAIIFTVDLTGYGRNLFEDETVDRFRDCLNFFNEIGKLGVFGATDVQICFTKDDLFKEQLFKDLFKDDEDPCEPGNVREFLVKQVERIYEEHMGGMPVEERKYALHCSFVNTMDTDAVDTLLSDTIQRVTADWQKEDACCSCCW